MAAAALCPLHGPVVKAARTQLVREYTTRVAAQVAKADRSSIAVIYASAYGTASPFTRFLSQPALKLFFA